MSRAELKGGFSIQLLAKVKKRVKKKKEKRNVYIQTLITRLYEG